MKNSIDYEKFYLKNGIKCVVYPRKELHSVSIRANVNVGSLYEDEDTSGLSHFIEHVSHDATEKMPDWQSVDEYINEYSGSTNAYTTLDHTQYYGTFPYQYTEQAIEYISEVVLKPLLKEEDLGKERDIILDEMKMRQDSVQHKIIDNIKKSRFVTIDNSFVYEVIGNERLIGGYTLEELTKFYKKYYIPSNIEIYIVGNVKTKKIKAILEKHFVQKEYDTSKPAKKEFRKEYPEYTGFTIRAEQKLDINQYYLALTFPSFEFTKSSQEERIKIGFLASMTASSQYFQSILWRTLREELGIVYDVNAQTYDMYSRAMFILNTSFNEQHLYTVLNYIYEGVNRIINGDIDTVVFDAKRKRKLNTQLMRLDKPEQALGWIADFEYELEEHGKAMSIDDYLAFIEKLRFEDIIETARKIYNWNKVNICVVTKNDIDAVEKQVVKHWEAITDGQMSLGI